MNEQGLPEQFIQRLRAWVPEPRLASVLDSFSATKPTSFRINPLKAAPADTLAALESIGLAPRPIDWCEHAFAVTPAQRATLTRSAPAADGRVYIQGRSSLLAGVLLAPQPGEEVLDLAAAPGGKTLHLAAMMRGQGAIAAVEPVRSRFFKLKANAERAGVADMIRLYQADGRFVGRKTPGRFDRVLIDAPCSSEARFRADQPDTFAFWNEKKIAESARKQKALLRSALDACRVGGRVLYCTCSTAPEENEGVVAHTLKRLGDAVELLGIDLPVANVLPGLCAWKSKAWPEVLMRTCRVLPDASCDAFYLALLEKRKPTT